MLGIGFTVLGIRYRHRVAASFNALARYLHSKNHTPFKFNRWTLAAFAVVIVQSTSVLLSRRILNIDQLSIIHYVATLFIWSTVWMFVILMAETIRSRFTGASSGWGGWRFPTFTASERRAYESFPRNLRVLMILNTVISQFVLTFLYGYAMHTSIAPHIFMLLGSASLGWSLFLSAF